VGPKDGNEWVPCAIENALAWSSIVFRLIPCHSSKSGNGRRMNRKIPLRTVGRPETGAGYIRQHVQVGGWHLRNCVHRLRAIGSAEDALAAVIQRCAFL